MLPPSTVRMAPPEPLSPSATLSLRRVSLLTLRVPPLLKIPPPPWSASSPLATLASMVAPRTVIVPVPFQRPPPSAAAVLPRMTPPWKLTSPAPVTW